MVFPSRRATLACSILVVSGSAIARPVIASDLTGKKICWSNGDKETYLSGGKYVSTAYGAGTWQLISAGVVAVQASAQWTSAIAKQSDGTFDAKAASGQWTGHYCK
jgi:hypothetical protein